MTIVPASTGELRRVAEMSPRVIPTVLAKSKARTVSSTVTGSRSSRIVGDRPPVADGAAEVTLDERSGIDHELLGQMACPIRSER